MHDRKLSEFYFLCKEKYSDLEEWILHNKWIITSNVSRNSPTFPGYSSLHLAVKSNNLNAVKLLLKHKADITHKNAKEQTPLHLGMQMILFNKNKVLKWEKNLLTILDEILLVHRDNFINSVNNVGLTHFHIACFRNIESVVLNFLKNGVNINSFIEMDSVYWAGYTPLHIATKYSHSNITSLLLTHGADINIKDATGLTPLHCAIRKGNGLFIQLFLSILNQNNVGFVDNRELSLLQVCCMAIDELDTLDIILDNLDNVNISVKLDSPLWAGCTPLHIAVYYKRIYLASILIQHGADINKKDRKNTSPFQLAVRKKLISSGFMSLILTKYNKLTEEPLQDIKLYTLITACITNDFKILKSLLDEGYNLNSSVPSKYPINLPGYRLLHFAVEQGEMEMIEFLLKNGADVCAQDVTGLSPIHLAVQNKNYKAVEKMFNFYTKIYENPVNCDGISHFHIACSCNRMFIIENMLKHKKVINLTTKTGETPLHYAVRFNAKKAVILLLKNNADITAQEFHLGLTPLHLAVENKNEEIIDILLSYHSLKIVNPVNKNGLSHFHIFCMKNKVNLIKNYLSNEDVVKNSVSLRSNKFAGFTPLHFAIKYNSLDSIKILLDQKANIFMEDASNKISLQYIRKLNPKVVQKVLDLFWAVIVKNNIKFISKFEISALHIACMRDDYSSVEYLLKSKFSIDACTHFNCPLWPGYSPLHFTVKYGGIKTLEMLIKYNANVKISDKYGFTPLHLACENSKKQVVEQLLLAGADSTVKNFFKVTPLRLAIQAKNEDIIKIILLHSSRKMENPMDNKGLTYFHIACLKNLQNIVEIFLRNKVNINEQVHFFAPKYCGSTALHLAVKFRHIKIIDLLLKYGANVNMHDAEGNTPLHLTCLPKIAYINICNVLIKNGGNPHIKNAFGDTIIELAIKYNHLKILKLILENEAVPNVKNCRPLELAINLHREKMIDELLLHGSDVTVKFPSNKTFFHQTILNVKADENYYFKIFRRLIEHGCDVNASDDSGRAALHNSYWPVNMPGLKALLRCGADVNVEDRSGRTVVSYFLEITTSRMPRTELYRIFRKHLEIRKLLGFDISQTNKALYDTLVEQAEDFLYNEENEKPVEITCKTEIQKMKELCFGRNETLFDLLKNMNLMARYLARNGSLNDFFRSGRFEEIFPQCGCVLMMQYGKALKRSHLMKQAVEIVDTLLWKKFKEIRWNEECSEALVEYLSDEDLRNLGAIREKN